MNNLKNAALLSAIILLAHISSCRRVENNTDRESATRLFELSERLIRTYSDSLQLASDTTALLRIEKSLTDKMAKVNFQFPPNTDITLTEEENDSLAHMMERFREKYDMKMKEMIGRLPVDSASFIPSPVVPVSVSQEPHPAATTISVDSITAVAGD